MTVTSTAFHQGEFVPKLYTCEGANINLPLTFSEIPHDTKSLVLVHEDTDTPNGSVTH